MIEYARWAGEEEPRPPKPPTQTPDAPVEEPPDSQQPDAPVREPGPEPPKKWG